MNQDEKQIRELISAWHERTRSGDLEGVLSLMSDDVVFSVVGRSPFGRAEFAATSRELQDVSIDTQYEVLEVTVRGDCAWSRVELRVSMTKPGQAASRREGYAMSIYTRQDGRWLLARDANLLGPPA